jgi:hypothetical protein
LWKKNEINLSRNDGFLGNGLSGLSFCSRQKARCDLLDLPVLNEGDVMVSSVCLRTADFLQVM